MGIYQSDDTPDSRNAILDKKISKYKKALQRCKAFILLVVPRGLEPRTT